MILNEQEIEESPFTHLDYREHRIELRVEYIVRYAFIVPTSTPTLKNEKSKVQKLLRGRYTGDIRDNSQHSALDAVAAILKGVFGNKPVYTRYVQYTNSEVNVLTLTKDDLACVDPDFDQVREQIAKTMHRNCLGYKQKNLDLFAAKYLLERGWNKSDLINQISKSDRHSKLSANLLITKAMLSHSKLSHQTHRARAELIDHIFGNQSF